MEKNKHVNILCTYGLHISPLGPKLAPYQGAGRDIDLVPAIDISTEPQALFWYNITRGFLLLHFKNPRQISTAWAHRFDR